MLSCRGGLYAAKSIRRDAEYILRRGFSFTVVILARTLPAWPCGGAA